MEASVDLFQKVRTQHAEHEIGELLLFVIFLRPLTQGCTGVINRFYKETPTMRELMWASDTQNEGNIAIFSVKLIPLSSSLIEWYRTSRPAISY